MVVLPDLRPSVEGQAERGDKWFGIVWAGGLVQDNRVFFFPQDDPEAPEC